MTFATQPKCILAALANGALLLSAALALHGQTSPDPAATLTRARLKISATMRRLPKYACLQTIDRSYFTRVTAPNSAAPACGQSNGDAKPDPKKARSAVRLDSTDRVRMEVAQGDTSEIHSWPGESHFITGHIDQLVGHGPIASGSFGGYLVDIFDNNGAQFHFLGEKAEAGRRIFEYAYRVPREISHYHVGADNDGWVVTGYQGTFEIDADSLELLRLKVQTEELPAETHLCKAESALEYARVRIGDGDFLLPRQSDLHLAQRSPRETDSTSVFTGCREFLAESVVSFDDDAGTPGASGASAAKSPIVLPEGISLPLRLSAAIDSDTAAAGDAVNATVTQPVRSPKSKAILIPAGAVAHGRISRMEHRLVPSPSFTFAIAWQTIEINGVASPLTANVDRSAETAPIRLPRQTLQRRPAPLAPPDALYFPTDAKRHVVKAGYEMRWMTIAPPQPKPDAATGK